MDSLEAERWRDRLFEAVWEKRMTPARAETAAARLGVGALKPQPPVVDVMAMSWWTLPMAIAWVAWRDVYLVATVSDEVRTHRYWWHPRLESGEVVGWTLEHDPRPPSFEDLQRIERHLRLDTGHDHRGDAEAARAALWKLFDSGALSARGFDADGRSTTVPPDNWHQLKVGEARDGRMALCWSTFGGAVAFERVTTRRTELIEAFPSRSDLAVSHVAAALLAREEFVAPAVDAPPPTEPKRRGAKKGQNAKPDDRLVKEAEALMDDGWGRWQAMTEIAERAALTNGEVDERVRDNVRARLNRKVRLDPPQESGTYTK